MAYTKQKLKLVNASLHTNENIGSLKKELEHVNVRLNQSQFIANYANWEWDLISNEIYWSENLFNIFHFNPDEIKPSLKALFRRIHPDDLKKVIDTIQYRGENNHPTEIDFRIILPDGSTRIIYCYSTLQYDSIEKQHTFLIGTIQDITERKHIENELLDIKSDLESRVRKRSKKLTDANKKLKKEIQERKAIEVERQKAENELKVSEERYRTIVESAPCCVKTITADGTLLNMNSLGLEMIEAENFEEVRGACVYDLIVEEYRADYIAMNQRVFEGETCDLQFQLEGLKGKRCWMETHAVPVYGDDNSKVITHLAITRDVTERVQYQNAIKESEERFRSSFERGPIGMGLGDKEGNILQVNNALCKFSGYTEKELLDKNFREFVHPDDIESSVINLKRLFAGEIEHYQQVRRYLHRQGHYIWADINVSVVKDSEGKPKLLINHLQDITERIQSEHLQEAQRKILEQIVSGATQQEILNKLCLLFESLAPEGAKASVLLLNSDDKKLYVGAAPSLSDVLVNAFEGFMTGESKASCGTAAHRGEKVIVDDVSASPLWSDFKDFALENKVLACWSTPFLSQNGEVLGTFAIALPRPTSPTPYDIERLDTAGYLASIVIERVRSMTELSKSEARFSGAFGNAPMGTALVDTKGIILQANSRSTEVLGFLPEEIIGKSIADVSHPEDLEVSLERFRALVSGEIDDYQIEKRYRHKQGHYVWCRLSLSTVHDQSNQPMYAIAHIEDISERKKSEVALLRYNRALKVVNQCNATLFHAINLEELLDQVCNIIVKTGGYRFSWVGYAEKDEAKSIVPKSMAGYEAGYLDTNISWKQNDQNYCPVTEAIITSKPKVIKNINTESRNIPWRKAALERGYNSCISLPLISDGYAFGAISIYSSECDVFDDEELILLVNLADNLSFGIQSIKNRNVREEAENSLRVSEQKFRALFDENPCMFFTVDSDATVLSVNNFGATELGYKPSEIIGRSLFSFTDDENMFVVNRHLKQCFDEPDNVHRWEMQTSRKSGEKLWVRVLARVAADVDNKNTILVVCEDITEARQLSDKLLHEATHDGLTGLINRHEFDTRLERAQLSSKTENSQHVLCYLDLDRFKFINDTCGHLAGDQLLQQLSKVLHSHIRNRDTLARLGGDEFGLLIEHCSLNQAEQIAIKIKEAITDFNFYWEENIYKVGVSIGMVQISEHSIDISDVLMTADNACYTAKNKGRDRIHIHYEGDKELETRRKEMLWTTRINTAFQENRFCLAYQSIAPLDSNENRGEHGEILIRMEDEKGNIISPNSFIPVAERYNLIIKIDMHVIDMTFNWLNENLDFLDRLYLCSINLSGHSIVDNDFMNYIIEKFVEYKIPENKICFEVTETAAIANLASASTFINKLKKQGCLFALDDFGSGLSSFAYLKSLPVDFLKIDGTFVKDIENENSDLAIVKSIHEIGRALNKRTIAEFVENESIMQILKGIGVNYAQGYGVQRPRPLIEINVKKDSKLVQK